MDKKMWHVHAMKYYSALKKERYPVICSNITEFGRYYAK
jgi:hypothetical protein